MRFVQRRLVRRRLRRWFLEPCWGPRRPLFCIGPTGIWVKADYLQWWEHGTHVPALVTSGPNADQPGVLGQPGTMVLFGDDYINDKSVSGGRIQAGMWLNPCATIGFEGEFFALADENTNYYLWSNGQPDPLPAVLRREPASTGRARSSSSPFRAAIANSVDGAININAITRFHGAGRISSSPPAARRAAGPTNAAAPPTTTASARTSSPAFGTWTWRTNSPSRKPSRPPTPADDAANPTGTPGRSAFLLQDQFNTRNTFNGADLGMKFEFSGIAGSWTSSRGSPWAPRMKWSISTARRRAPVRPAPYRRHKADC